MLPQFVSIKLSVTSLYLLPKCPRVYNYLYMGMCLITVDPNHYRRYETFKLVVYLGSTCNHSPYYGLSAELAALSTDQPIATAPTRASRAELWV